MSDTCDGIKIGKLRLWEERGNAIEPVPQELCQALAPATHCLPEWADYWVEFPEADELLVSGRRAINSRGRFKARF